MNTLNDDLVRKLAASYETPLYVFDESSIRRQCAALIGAVQYPGVIIKYACKALTLKPVLQIVRDCGLRIDASSYNETLRAQRAGFAPDEITYTGEGANVEEFQFMAEAGVHLNCSSLDQIRLVGTLPRKPKISVRFNPGEGHGHHHKVNTGGPASKHGIYFNFLQQVKDLAREHGIIINGVHTHIGSGTDLAHWLKIKDITLQLAEQFEDLEFVNLGGGLPVVYNQEKEEAMPLTEWGNALSESMSAFSKRLGKNILLHLEPGRFVVAECGHLIAEVQGFKQTPDHHFVIVNTGFTHNIRPAMYGAFHPIRFVTKTPRPTGKEEAYVIAGNLCESGDVFTINAEHEPCPRSFTHLQVGDLMVMGLVGAYSHSMMSEYNSMSLPASVLVASSGDIRLIERRGNFEDLVRREVE